MENIELSFDADEEAIKKSSANLEGTLFMGPPFIGRFYFKIGEDDVMKHTYHCDPFAYVQWFLNSHKSWSADDSTANRTRAWKAYHTFVSYLGDRSPNILIYRGNDKELVVPMFKSDYGAAAVSFEDFRNEVRKVSAKAMSILGKNKKFVKTSTWKEMLGNVSKI